MQTSVNACDAVFDVLKDSKKNKVSIAKIFSVSPTQQSAQWAPDSIVLQSISLLVHRSGRPPAERPAIVRLYAANSGPAEAVHEEGGGGQEQLLPGQRHLCKVSANGRCLNRTLGFNNCDSCCSVVHENVVMLHRILQNDFIIPEFRDFCALMGDIFDLCEKNTSGTTASYIPQLARFSSKYWGLSLCSIDGQR